MKINEPQNFNSVEKHNAENTELLRWSSNGRLEQSPSVVDLKMLRLEPLYIRTSQPFLLFLTKLQIKRSVSDGYVTASVCPRRMTLSQMEFPPRRTWEICLCGLKLCLNKEIRMINSLLSALQIVDSSTFYLVNELRCSHWTCAWIGAMRHS